MNLVLEMQNIFSNSKPEPSKEAISLETIDRSIRELHRAIDAHRSVMVSVLGQDNACVQIESPPHIRRSASFREREIKNVIGEAIEVLEESRKAFKSKKFEVLRKKLTSALIDTPT